MKNETPSEVCVHMADNGVWWPEVALALALGHPVGQPPSPGSNCISVQNESLAVASTVSPEVAKRIPGDSPETRIASGLLARRNPIYRSQYHFIVHTIKE